MSQVSSSTKIYFIHNIDSVAKIFAFDPGLSFSKLILSLSFYSLCKSIDSPPQHRITHVGKQLNLFYRIDLDTYLIVRLFCALYHEMFVRSCLVHSEVVVYLRFELAFICLFRQSE